MVHVEDEGGSGRIRRLTQAALNADVTLERVGGVAVDLGASLDDFQRVLTKMDGMLEAFGVSLEDFAGSIRDIDELTGPLSRAGDLDELLERVERITATVDWALTPVTWARAGSERALDLAGSVVSRIGGAIMQGGRSPMS